LSKSEDAPGGDNQVDIREVLGESDCGKLVYMDVVNSEAVCGEETDWLEGMTSAESVLCSYLSIMGM